MNWTRTLTLGVGLALTLGTGCAGCFGDNNENNSTNNATNNGTNASNNGTNASNNGTNNVNNETVVVECSTSEELDLSNVTMDTIVQKGEDGVCYSSGSIKVNDGTLTIEPGVVILFEENAEFVVGVNGRLLAEGTASEPIVLTTEREVPGYWKGLQFDRTNSIDNILDYVTIQYAGRDVEAGLRVTSCCGDTAKVAITNSTVEFSQTFGFWIANSTEVTLEGNTFRNNVGGAGYAHSNVLTGLSADNDLTGNDLDVLFTGGTVSGGEHVWANFGIPYRVQEDIVIGSGAIVDVDAGAEFRFEETVGLKLNADDNSLAFNGEDGNEILLTGVEQERGFWKGIDVDRSEADENIWNYVTIEYAGGGSSVEGAVTFGGCCGDLSRFSLNNVTIRESETFGFVTSGNVVITEWENVTLTANGSGAARLSPGQVQYIGTGDNTGNDNDFFSVVGGVVNDGAEHTWVNPGVPLRFLDDVTVNGGSVLTMSPGTEVEGATGVRFQIGLDSGLNAVGTESDPIVFRGVEATAGFWQGIEITRTELPINNLDYIEVHDAGGGSADASLQLTTCCGDPLALTLNNITIDNGEKAGISVPSAIEIPYTPSAFYSFTGCAGLTVTNTPQEITNGDVEITIADFASQVCE